MPRVTQTITAVNASSGDMVQLSPGWTGGQVPIMVFTLALINYTVGDYATAAAAAGSGKVNIIYQNVNIMFGPVDPSKMWVRANGAAASNVYWDTIS